MVGLPCLVSHCAKLHIDGWTWAVVTHIYWWGLWFLHQYGIFWIHPRMWIADGEINGSAVGMWHHTVPHFSAYQLCALICTTNLWWKWPCRWIFMDWEVYFMTMLVTHWAGGKFFKILMQIILNEWKIRCVVKCSCLCSRIFIKWEICWKSTICVHYKDFGTKFFQLLTHKNFLSGGILTGFPCVVYHNDGRGFKFHWLKTLVTLVLLLHHPLSSKKNKTSQNFSLILLNLEAILVINFKHVVCLREIQGDQKVSVHLMIAIQKVTSNVQSVPCQSPDMFDTLNCVLDSHLHHLLSLILTTLSWKVIETV
jgi:hypothetical protein